MKHKVFDAHFHVGSFGTQEYAGKIITPIVNEHASYKECAKYLNKFEIKYGLVVPTYVDDQYLNFRYNNLIQECINKITNLYGGFWVSPIPECRGWIRDVLNKISHPKIKVLKMSAGTWGHYSLAPKSWDSEFTANMENILDFSHEHNIVIQFHTGSGNSDPLFFDEFMKQYGTRTRYHFIHMGESTGQILKFVPRFLEWIDAGFDVYTDQVMTPSFGLIWLVKKLSEKNEDATNRLLFGTDAPWSNFESEYAKIEALDVSDNLKEKILFKNACKLFSID